MQDFPRTADAIDARWLERMLRARPELASVRVDGCALEPLGARSATGQLLRVRISYAGEPRGPASLIAKLASSRAEVREAAASGYARELAFYEELGTGAGVSLPAFYGGALDRQSGEMILLLEELADPPGRYPRLALAERTLAELVPMHARFWASPRLSSLPWLHDADADRFYDRAFVQAAEALPRSLGDALPATFAAVAKLLAARLRAAQAWMNDAPHTLVHGDLHLQQVWCSEAGRFALLDWQTVRAAPAVSDVARLIVSSTEPETQAAHEARLVESYRRALVDHGVTDYPLEACFEHYRRAILQSVYIHTLGAAQLDLSQFQARSAAQGRAWTERFFGWVDAALVRHGLLQRLEALA